MVDHVVDRHRVYPAMALPSIGLTWWHYRDRVQAKVLCVQPMSMFGDVWSALHRSHPPSFVGSTKHLLLSDKRYI
jgi:hypothetical protein